MADGGEIASLFATLGLKVNAGQWAQGTQQIGQARDAVGRFTSGTGAAAQGAHAVGAAAESAGRRGAGAFSGLGSSIADTAKRAEVLGLSLGGIAAYLGERMVKSGVEFNATLEDSQNKVAGLMALAKHTDFNAELANAGMLMENLEKAAAKLPGETSHYVEMLSLIAQPVADAKLGLKELEQLTISATSTALTMHIDPGQAARDIEGALNGLFNSRDRFTRPLLGARGFKGEEGRERFNALDAKDRAKELMAAFNAPQLDAMGKALGKSFSGVLSTLEDAWHRFERAIAKPLFEKLSVQIERLNAWFDENKVKIMEVAAKIGGVLVTAFDTVVKAIRFFVEHATFAKSLLIAIGVVLAGLAVAWVAGFWPIFAVIAAVTALVYAIEKLMDYPGGVEQAFSDAFDAIGDAASDAWGAIKSGFKSAFEWVADLPVVKQLVYVVDKLGSISSYTKTGGSGATKSGDNFSWMDMVPIFGNLAHLGNLAAGREDFSWTNFVPGAGLARHFLGGSGDPGLPRDPELQPDRWAPFAPTAPNSAAQSSATVINVGGIGDINVNAPNADPVAVGDQVRKVFHEELGNTLRKTKDMYG